MSLDVAQIRVGDPGCFIEHRVEGIFRDVTAHAGAAPRRGLQQRAFVVAGPGMCARAVDADVAGEHQRQIRCAVVKRGVEIVVDSLADVDRDRMPRLGRFPDVFGESPHEVARGAGYLLDRFLVVVLQMSLIHFQDRHHFHCAAVGQLDAMRALERCVDLHVHADFVAADERHAIAVAVPDAEVADLLALLVGEPLHLVRRAGRNIFGLVAGLDVLRPQSLQRVGPHQQREIGEPAAEVGLVPAVVDHDLRDAQQHRQVRQAGTRRDPVVRLARRAVVLRRDVDQLGPAFHALVEPVRLRHLVLDQVLSDLDHELRKPQVVEIHV